ncbi:polyadenylate-binding protein 2-like [Phalaenopsis equestris]|uniref:polyadenylate-binding protein 2-like n=1 Tax=Phalaenopsis equestris TaxID=78828 RepID=UPI0009E5BF49|nr:polyadenylate-binding protein 2-like [Phalaenopsis equestris]
MAQVQIPLAVSNGSLEINVASSSGGDGNANALPSTSLYVGDLDSSVTDSQLFDLFGQIGQVVSVRVCRDVTTRRSLGYAYVNFSNPVDAARALELLNFTPLYGKPIRIMYSNRDPSLRKSSAANIFIKNLEKAIDNKGLLETFSVFGNILSCKVETDASGQSKGFGFVQFEKEEAALNAIEKLNGMCLNDKPIYVGRFHRKAEREIIADIAKFNNVFVKNLSESTTEDHLKEVFGEFGKITSTVVMRADDGKSKCFGFVNFENPDDAARAVNELNGKKFDGKEWYVGKALKKYEREREIEFNGRSEPSNKEIVNNYQGLNLFLKNLDDSIGDEKLKELFSEFGTITSCKVMRESNGASKGSGFVAFSTAGEASRALSEMNGKMIGSKPLYVAYAQRKEERRAQLQAHYAPMRPVAVGTSAAPRLPMYSPGAPGLQQQLFYGQGPPTLIPPQTGFGFQQQLLSGVRPGGVPMPNFLMPLGQQAPQAQRPSLIHPTMGPIQPQRPLPIVHHQMLPRGRGGYRYPLGRNGFDVPMPGGFTGRMPSAYDMGGWPAGDGAMMQTTSVDSMTTALANATPDQQRMILGENLYPLVYEMERENSAKVTGMLLELDQTEVLHLLESPEALKAKVGEALEVLKDSAGAPPLRTATDQLAGLSLNPGLVS